MLIIPTRTKDGWVRYGDLDRRAPAAAAAAAAAVAVAALGGSGSRDEHYHRLRARQLASSSPSPSGTGTGTATTDPTSSSSSSGIPNSGWAFGGSKSQILNWAAIAVVVGLMVVIAGWRLATIRERSLRSFFLPKGLRIKWLGVDIKPPPPPPARPTPSELEQQRRARRAEERFQRRRTRGDNIGEGGQRQDGDVDYDDDDWSIHLAADQELQGEEGSEGVPMQQRRRNRQADRESLPGYKADISAPVYLEEWRLQAEQQGTIPTIDPATEEAIRQSGPVIENGSATATGGGPSGSAAAGDGDISNHPLREQEQDRIMSVAEYEARQRGDAHAYTTTTRSHSTAIGGETQRTAEGLESLHARTQAEEDEYEEAAEEEEARRRQSAANAQSQPPASPTLQPQQQQQQQQPPQPGTSSLANRVVSALRRPEPVRTNSTRSNPPLYDNLSRVPSRSDQ